MANEHPKHGGLKRWSDCILNAGEKEETAIETGSSVCCVGKGSEGEGREVEGIRTMTVLV